jgi:hypothetical protein
MYEKEIRFIIKSEKAQINSSIKSFIITRKYNKNDRGPLRWAKWYSCNNVGKLALVFELMEMNLYECLKNKKNPLTFQKIKFYMFQTLKAI